MVCAIVTVAMFVGCVEEEEAPTASFPTPTATPTPVANVSPSQSPTPAPKPIERAEISSIDAKPVDFDGYPALNVSIYVSKFAGDLNVTVKNEDADILDTVIISPEKEQGWIRTYLKLGDYHETLKEKELCDVGYYASRLRYKFTVILSDAQGELADNTFTFDGAKLMIGTPYFDMLPGIEDKYGNKIYFVYGLHYSLRNEGDLPAYPCSAKFKGSTFERNDTILGHKTEGYSHSLSMEICEGSGPPGYERSYGIRIFDNEGEKLAHTTWEVYLKY